MPLLAAVPVADPCPRGLEHAAEAESRRRPEHFVDRVGDDIPQIFGRFHRGILSVRPLEQGARRRDRQGRRETQRITTKDWKLFNRHYLFDGDWYAVEWFYSATTIKTGGKQVESTLAFGHVQDGKTCRLG